MMARQHVTFAVGVAGAGLATAAAAAPAVERWVVDKPWEALLFLLLVAGGALVPDADHPKSTITKKMGWLGWMLNKILVGLGVKHRGFMHSFLFAVISGVVFLGIELLLPLTEWVAIALLILFMFFASITFGFIFGKVGRNPAFLLALTAGIIYGYSTGAATAEGHWLALGAFIGPLLHDLGDMLTKSKFAFWAPFSKKKVGAFVGFTTNTLFETVFLRAVFFAWSLMMIAWVVGMSQGYFVRTDFSEADLADPNWWASILPYILWQFS